MATLEQERATFALERVEEVVQRGKDEAKYKTQLLKLPARLHNNGLGQTVAFYLSSGGEKPEVVICNWLEAWLRKRGTFGPEVRLIDGITGKHATPDKAESDYREASVEVRALSVWLKRFAEAFIEGEEEVK